MTTATSAGDVNPTQTAAIGVEAPWHGERPGKICEAIAQFWSEWEDERAGAGVYLPDELAENAGEFANDLFDHLASLSQPVAAPQVDWSDEAKQSWEAQTGQPSDQMPQPEGGTVAQEVERLRTAIEQALKCTPFIRSTPSQFHGVGRLHEIAYECGDPWKILWAALQPEKTKP